MVRRMVSVIVKLCGNGTTGGGFICMIAKFSSEGKIRQEGEWMLLLVVYVSNLYFLIFLNLYYN